MYAILIGRMPSCTICFAYRPASYFTDVQTKKQEFGQILERGLQKKLGETLSYTDITLTCR